jgi:hypothetical protein
MPDAMLGIMLARARARGAAAFVDETPIFRKLSVEFDQQLEPHERGYLDVAASHWRHAAALPISHVGDLARLWPGAVLSDLRASTLLPEVHSANASASPTAVAPSMA